MQLGRYRWKSTAHDKDTTQNCMKKVDAALKLTELAALPVRIKTHATVKCPLIARSSMNIDQGRAGEAKSTLATPETSTTYTAGWAGGGSISKTTLATPETSTAHGIFLDNGGREPVRTAN